jgi:molybdate transport system substrate-binding protein
MRRSNDLPQVHFVQATRIMKIRLPLRLIILVFAPVLTMTPAIAEEIRVAVASNFSEAMHDIARRFEARSGDEVTLIIGSTGKHYAQIKNGAPFDLFFAADSARPKLLEHEGIAIHDSRFTYALGKLLLWSPNKDLVDTNGKILSSGKFRYLAIANERLAPYGIAAVQVMQGLGLWNELRGQLVRGESIGQAFQFVKSGNAELGFVACSQVIRPDQAMQGSYWDIPQTLYAPIEQQAVLLKNSPAARAFLDFTKSSESLEIIRRYGYTTS